jgi:hypothetical protein
MKVLKKNVLISERELRIKGLSASQIVLFFEFHDDLTLKRDISRYYKEAVIAATLNDLYPSEKKEEPEEDVSSMVDKITDSLLSKLERSGLLVAGEIGGIVQEIKEEFEDVSEEELDDLMGFMD